VNNELIIGGDFTSVGGIGVNRIAKWTGSWGNLGIGVNGSVYSLTAYNGQLIAGGQFSSAGGISASRIALWNGNTWSALGSGMNNTVRSLTVYGGLPYAGGSFTTAGGISANRIARWGSATEIQLINTSVPDEFILYQNYPNPFNPNTKIRFSVPLYEGRKENVSLKIYDILGCEVATLVNEPLATGTYEYNWDGTIYPSGIYCYKLISNAYSETKKMTLLK
jgi:hypothetical protein